MDGMVRTQEASAGSDNVTVSFERSSKEGESNLMFSDTAGNTEVC